RASLARVQLAADGLELAQALDRHLRLRAAARRLHLDLRQAHPALAHVAREVDVLDARVGETHLAPEQDAPVHADALVVELVAQRAVADRKSTRLNSS